MSCVCADAHWRICHEVQKGLGSWRQCLWPILCNQADTGELPGQCPASRIPDLILYQIVEVALGLFHDTQVWCFRISQGSLVRAMPWNLLDWSVVKSCTPAGALSIYSAALLASILTVHALQFVGMCSIQVPLTTTIFPCFPLHALHEGQE